MHVKPMSHIAKCCLMEMCCSTGRNQGHSVQQRSGPVFLSSGARQGEQTPPHPHPSLLEVMRVSSLKNKLEFFCYTLLFQLRTPERNVCICIVSEEALKHCSHFISLMKLTTLRQYLKAVKSTNNLQSKLLSSVIHILCA